MNIKDLKKLDDIAEEMNTLNNNKNINNDKKNKVQKQEEVLDMHL